MNKSLAVLRYELYSVEDEIARHGWEATSSLTKMYRHWIIKTIQWLQLRDFDKS